MTSEDTADTAVAEETGQARTVRPPHGFQLELPHILQVTLTPAAAGSIAEHAAASVDGLETGGLLLGHVETNRVVVHFAGGPGPGAFREPTRFQRDLGHAQGLADAAWRLNRSIWVGEWHTHPNASAEPSDIDMQTYQQHLTDPDLTLSTFLSLIVVADADAWTDAHVVPWTVALVEGTPDKQIAVAVVTNLTVDAGPNSAAAGPAAGAGTHPDTGTNMKDSV